MTKRVASIPFRDLPPSKPVRLPYPPYDVLVVRVGDEVFAIEDGCNHAGASLSTGPVTRTCGIICPMHGYVFDLRNGKLLRPKGLCGDQRTYEVVREGDDVVIYDPFELTVESPREDEAPR